MKLAILDDYTDRAPDHDELVRRLRDVDGLILIRERTQITEALLSQLPSPVYS